MADVIITEGTAGLMEISLQKCGREIKSVRFMKPEWDSLVEQITISVPTNANPIDVVTARYRRLHNAGCNCTPLAQLLETVAQIKEDPDGFVQKEKLEGMMAIVVRKP